jgi:hypothetical protein
MTLTPETKLELDRQVAEEMRVLNGDKASDHGVADRLLLKIVEIEGYHQAAQAFRELDYS